MDHCLGNLIFKPIDIERHGQICIHFSEDAYTASFVNADKFHKEDGKGSERYLAWLKEKIENDPRSCMHIWSGEEIIGQLVLEQFKFDREIGYVNLYYLIPEKRGLGLSRHLDEYACLYLKSLGLSRARLSVSPTNRRALAYYKKQGWRDIGPRPDHPEVNLMEKKI